MLYYESMKKLNIVLVDDDEDDRQFFAEALQSLEINSKLVLLTDGQKCIDYLSEPIVILPDLIFLDLNMPIMDGVECLEVIRRQPNLKKIVVAIYSTSSSSKDIEDTFEKGANVYITKPNSFKDLKNTLKQVLETNWTYHSENLTRQNFLVEV